MLRNTEAQIVFLQSELKTHWGQTGPILGPDWSYTGTRLVLYWEPDCWLPVFIYLFKKKYPDKNN